MVKERARARFFRHWSLGFLAWILLVMSFFFLFGFYPPPFSSSLAFSFFIPSPFSARVWRWVVRCCWSERCWNV
ncbi:uncharacterized protein J3D65DRAFT_628124 [Phyllosticta citribraziliensis]|uniref:Uncharacterized protein n=1 Tax=Phyllosticta citribraziliensis TaxID=989973 RepID=A0ABR1LP56_9PEZI